jgi:PncC family amidohydrolase
MSDLETKLGELLTVNNLTLATAESCTGGLIAHMITNVSGSSKYFERGLITYSNDSKIGLLNVPEKTIIEFGAVSAQTAKAMALGVRNLAGTDLGLAVTGIAGPGGGTPEKPVGLVFIALSGPEQLKVQEHRFSGSRLEIKKRTAQAALKIIIEHIEDKS